MSARRRRQHARHVEALIGAAPGAFAMGPAAYTPVAEELVGFGALAAAAVSERTAAVIDDLWDHGWTPSAVLHVVGRRLGARHVDTAGAALLHDRDRQHRDGQAVHPGWERQIAAVAADRARRRVPADDAAGDAAGDADGLRRLLDVLCVLLSLGPVAQVLPRPSCHAVDGVVIPHGLDERMLARVRALLAKAESTAFEQEAEALSAKAQELITRHAMAAALVRGAQQDVGEPSARRVLLDDPYADAKAALVAAVGHANRCRCVHLRAYGWVTVFGFEADLDAVEVLSASLLVQATGAMGRHGPTRDAAGRSTTRSFRRAFLFGFAHRIGQRLAQVAAEQVAAAAAHEQDVLPVLSARDDRVAAAVQAAYPRISRHRASVSSGRGWTAGTAAADEADLTLPAARLDAGRS